MIIRKLRLQRGWSQDQLAEFSGLSVRTIQRLERGSVASLESLKALASVFDVDMKTFSSEGTDMTAQKNQPEIIEVSEEERDALHYARQIREFCDGLAVFVVVALVFLGVVGTGQLGDKSYIVFWVLGGVGVGLLIQGLLAFGVIGFDFPKWERRIVEKRLGRRL